MENINSKTDCIFCKIINKEQQSNIFYETDNIIAFFDYSPNNKYHALVVPKKHFENIFEADEEIMKELIVAVTKICKAYKKVFGVENLNILNNNGKIAGQIIMHYHIHIIPRKENDGFQMKGIHHEEYREEFSEWKEKLVKYFNKKEKEHEK